jgi:hypothetical protein
MPRWTMAPLTHLQLGAAVTPEGQERECRRERKDPERGEFSYR